MKITEATRKRNLAHKLNRLRRPLTVLGLIGWTAFVAGAIVLLVSAILSADVLQAMLAGAGLGIFSNFMLLAIVQYDEDHNQPNKQTGE